MGELLANLLVHPHHGTRTHRHRAFVNNFLAGIGSGPKLSDIIQMIYDHPDSVPPTNHHDREEYFSFTTSPASISYAQPSLSTWASSLIQKQLQREGRHLTSSQIGLRVRASRATGTPGAAAINNDSTQHDQEEHAAAEVGVTELQMAIDEDYLPSDLAGNRNKVRSDDAHVAQVRGFPKMI